MLDKPNQGVSPEWFLRGEHDFQSAKLLFKEGGHTDTVAFLLHQATEKYLKGYLLTKGWKLQKTHDLEPLVNRATKYDEAFQEFLDFARSVSEFYLESRYPPGPPVEYPRDEIANLLSKTEELIARIKGEKA